MSKTFNESTPNTRINKLKKRLIHGATLNLMEKTLSLHRECNRSDETRGVMVCGDREEKVAQTAPEHSGCLLIGDESTCSCAGRCKGSRTRFSCG